MLVMAEHILQTEDALSTLKLEQGISVWMYNPYFKAKQTVD